MFGQWSGDPIASDSAFIVHLYKGLGGLYRFDDDALYLYLHATEVNNISINADNLLRPTLGRRCNLMSFSDQWPPSARTQRVIC
jgi:hypothetical protein